MIKRSLPCSILAIAYKHCHQDPRIIRELAALVDAGYKVDFICTRPPSKPKPSLRGVRVFALPFNRRRGIVFRYLLEYLVFGIYVFFMTTFLFFRHRYRLILPFVMPEFIVVLCVIPKLLQAKILMDWEDPSMEVFLAKFDGNSKGIFISLVSLFERIAVHLTDVIITPNEGFRRTFVRRGHKRQKMHIIMNAPDSNIFRELPTNGIYEREDRFTLLYSGTIVPRHGLHILIKALPHIVEKIPNALLQIVGSEESDYFDECKQLGKTLGMEEHVEFKGSLFITEIPAIIRACSVGVVPNVRDEFTMINFPQRILEFGLLKKPIVVSKLPGIEDYFDDMDLCFFEPENHLDLARKIIDLHNSPEKRNTFISNTYAVTKKIRWKEPFLGIVKSLVERK